MHSWKSASAMGVNSQNGAWKGGNGLNCHRIPKLVGGLIHIPLFFAPSEQTSSSVFADRSAGTPL